MAFSKKERFSEDLQITASLARCMAHPARLRIINFLAENGRTQFGLLLKHIPLASRTIRQHLKMLGFTGMVDVDEDVPCTYYSLSTKECHFCIEKMQSYLTVFENNL